MNRRLVSGVTKCSFGTDYMKHYACQDAESAVDKAQRVLGLMGYDSNGSKTLKRQSIKAKGPTSYDHQEKKHSNLAMLKP